MKLLNLMNNIVLLHKKVKKSQLNGFPAIENDKLLVLLSKDGVDIRIKTNPPAKSDSIFSISVYNEKTNHKNNTIDFDGAISAFFRMSTGTEITLIDNNGKENIIDIPRYNDNEDELLFALSTITNSEIIITMMAIFLTLDTSLACLYAHRMKEEDLGDIINIIDKALEWITSNTAI